MGSKVGNLPPRLDVRNKLALWISAVKHAMDLRFLSGLGKEYSWRSLYPDLGSTATVFYQKISRDKNGAKRKVQTRSFYRVNRADPHSL